MTCMTTLLLLICPSLHGAQPNDLPEPNKFPMDRSQANFLPQKKLVGVGSCSGFQATVVLQNLLGTTTNFTSIP